MRIRRSESERVRAVEKMEVIRTRVQAQGGERRRQRNRNRVVVIESRFGCVGGWWVSVAGIVIGKWACEEVLEDHTADV